jgi:hypothetical protein
MNTKLTHYSDFSVVSNIQSTGLVSLYLITSLEHTRFLFPWILAPKTRTTTTIILYASYISRGKKLGQHLILTFLNTRKLRPSVYIFNSWLKQEGDCDPELINLIIEAGKRYEHEDI